jgi:hypothetical protein
MRFSGVIRMTTVRISLIAMGAALVCVGLVFRPRAPWTDPAANLDHDEFRTILDALDEADRRVERPGPAASHDQD